MSMTRTTRRRHPRLSAALLALTLAFAALIGAAPANAAKGKGKVTRLQVNCAGDVLSGKAKVSGAANVSLRLLTKRSAKAKFVATSKTRLLRAGWAGSYRFKFDVSALSAYAYRVRASERMQSRVVPSTSCAPGYQVPEAPLALLLPLSLLLAVGLPLALRRRRVAADS